VDKQDKNKEIPEEEFEAEQNLLGLFAILLAVDRRINPENYEFLNQQKDND
jgi:hypothetical protein